jgi:type VI secretion system protein ImpG
MDRRFLRYFEQELRFVRDLAHEFALDHARVANRFGLEKDSCADPHVEWLLDGFAFLAARVQMKLDGEQETFTRHLLELTLPTFAAPRPSAGIVQVEPDPAQGLMEAGFAIPRGTLLASRGGSETRCLFTTAHTVTLWPIRLARARWIPSGSLGAFGLAQGPEGRAALVFELETLADLPIAALALDRLPLHFAGGDRIAFRLFEAMTAHATALLARPAGAAGWTFRRSADEAIVRLGVSDEEALFPVVPRMVSAFRLLQEYFLLPRRFLFVELQGLAPMVRACNSRRLEIAILLDRADPVLDGAVDAHAFALFSTPVINLFRKVTRPVPVEPFEREHHLVVDRLRPLDFEVFDVLSVEGVGADERERVRFEPFYAVDRRGEALRGRAFYALDRRPRLVAGPDGRGRPQRSAYLGSEVFLQLCDGEAAPWPHRLRRLDVVALCTNRDLPIHLPLPTGESHFTTELGAPLRAIRALGRLADPAPALVRGDEEETGPHGFVAWRLAGLLAVAGSPLLDGEDGDGADALRALLALFASRAERARQREIEGVRALRGRRVTDRLPGPGPLCLGRGLELTLELDEAAFGEGSAFLLGSVLELVFRRWVALNGFVSTVVRSRERGELVRWPARIGSRHLM